MTISARRRLLGRRDLLGFMGAGALALQAWPVRATTEAKTLSFYNIHTGETLTRTYWDSNGYQGQALADIDYFLRDHRTGDVTVMDLRLLDLVHALRAALQSDGTFEVISGYRSPKTNEMLRRKGTGVAENSLHMSGRAIDIRLPGRHLTDLRDTAIALQGGGVGFYPKSNFLHVDIGPVQQW